jgi:hypothetical protein
MGQWQDMRRVLPTFIGVLWLLAASPARGQERVEPDTTRADGLSLPPYDEAAAGVLSNLSLEQVRARRVEGFILLSWGLANVAAGLVMAGVGHEDDTWLFAGLTTGAWGLINAGLSLVLLDLGGARRRAATQIRDQRGRLLFDTQNERVDAQRKSATIFALNAGLDIAYILAGVLLYALGTAQTPEEPWMLAVGGTAVVQGGGLLVFDIVNWLGSNGRANALRRAIP